MDIKQADIINTKDYISFLNDIKQDIRVSRVRAHLAINKELIALYYRIGSGILGKQKLLGWGSKVIEQLSQDLHFEFPGVKGFSPTNLKYMRILASRIAFEEFSPQAVDQIPWGHIRCLLDTFEDKNTIFWYIKKTIENGWSRNILSMHIEGEAHLKLGAALTNFADTLPKPQSDLANSLIKSEYNFEFLGITEEVHEKVIEAGLIENIRKFLLQLGSGFAFLGSQYRVTLAGEEFVLDMLMYHVKLKSYIVLELKAGKFKPEYAGKLSFYLTAIDKEIKDKHDNPTIGILLCQSANKLIVDYCLGDIRKPIGVSEYKAGILPEDVKKYLPTQEQFQHVMDIADKVEKE
jgi:predicted nuclease of restriction endonuclease-like (RecB) superfamily